MDYSLENFESSFRDFGVSFDPSLHAICEEMCKTNNLDTENFCENWIAYKFSNQKHQEMSATSLEAFGRYLSEKTSKALETPKRSKMIMNGLASPYTPNSAKKRPRSTPEPESASKRRIVTNPADGTPVRICRAPPNENTPSGKYSNRKNKGQIVTSNVDGKRKHWGRSRNDGETLIGSRGAEMVLENFKYMYSNDGAKVSVLNEMITNMVEKVDKMENIPQISEIGVVFQEPRIVVGRICVDGEKQICLEEGNTGTILPLSLASLNEFFLFPGEIVALECTNITGKCLSVLKVLENVTPSMPEYHGARALSIVVASGPFSTGDVVFEPLEDLMKYLEKETPDVCLLFGPFIDCSLAEEKCDEDFESLQNGIFDTLSNLAKRLGFQFVIVPSQRDFLHEPVFPQPPFRKFSPDVLCMSDPCTLNIEGLIVGMTSTDVLFHLNKEVVSKTQMSVNRVSRLAQCLLNQQNYYPLYPPSLDVNLDLEAFQKYGSMDVLPHILITPSELSCFIKTVEGTTCINPGRLAKMQAGGTFCRIFVQPGSQSAPVIEAEVVRI